MEQPQKQLSRVEKAQKQPPTVEKAQKKKMQQPPVVKKGGRLGSHQRTRANAGAGSALAALMSTSLHAVVSVTGTRGKSQRESGSEQKVAKIRHRQSRRAYAQRV